MEKGRIKRKILWQEVSFVFFQKKKKREWWYYIVKKQPQIWAKMEYNLFCETIISNKLGKERLRVSLRILNCGIS